MSNLLIAVELAHGFDESLNGGVFKKDNG